MGIFVVFEGVEGSGKTTQSRSLQRRLSAAGHKTTLVHEPGSTPAGERIRRWLKTGTELTPLAELFLFSAARATLVETVIRPALARDEIVVCDRYTYSTVAYQGHGRGIDLRTIAELNDVASRGLVPDLVLLLDMPADDGLARKSGGARDRFEAESADFHHRVREAYLSMARQDPDRWLTIDSTRARAEVSIAAWERVSAVLGERR